MTKQLLVGMAAVCWMASSVCAMPTIEGGSHYVEPGASARLPVLVSGGDSVPGLEFYVQIGDGGAANGGSDTAPIITAIDIIGPGTIFHGKGSGSNPFSAGPLIFGDSVTTDVGQTVAAEGTLAYVTIDAAGAAPGSYPLRLQGVYTFDWPGGLHTNFTDYGPATAIHDGWIVVVPEPSTLVLLGIGGVAVLIARYGRRRIVSRG